MTKNSITVTTFTTKMSTLFYHTDNGNQSGIALYVMEVIAYSKTRFGSVMARPVFSGKNLKSRATDLTGESDLTKKRPDKDVTTHRARHEITKDIGLCRTKHFRQTSIGSHDGRFR